MSTSTSGEGEIRKKIIDADLVDCMIALPPQLFYSVTIPVCLWFLSRDKTGHKGKTLFIDARKMGYMATRNNRDFTDEDIARIADTYHDWTNNKNYEDIAGFCKSATIADIATQGYVLTPGRYVGTENIVDDDETFNEKMQKLTTELSNQMAKGAELDIAICEQLAKIGWKVK
jgi:type I restriction enzyme M protein